MGEMTLIEASAEKGPFFEKLTGFEYDFRLIYVCVPMSKFTLFNYSRMKFQSVFV